MKNLLHCMDKAEAHAKEKGENIEDYIQLQIYPDMKNFGYQIQRVSDTAKFVYFRLCDVDPATGAMPDTESTWAEFRDRLSKTITLLETQAKPEAFAGAESKPVELFGGRYKFNGQKYLTVFAIPNFYFHLTTAYDLLRGKGVPVGKTDYIAGKDGM